ncbi:hypothetical protein [Nocardioides marmoraquaticus]
MDARPPRLPLPYALVVAGGLVAGLALLLAPLSPQPTAVPVVLGVLALAVAASLALRLPLVALRVGGALPPTAYAAWPTRRALVLDVEHHPRRPRAPGVR